MIRRACLAVAASALASHVALAQTETATRVAAPVDLEWNAPPECPARAAVLGEVTRTLGSAQVVNRATRVRVDITRGPGAGYRGTLRILSEGGGVHERQLDADDCAAVTSAAALIMALAVEGVLPPPPPEPAPAAPAPVPTVDARPNSPPPPTTPWHAHLVVSAHALVDTATLPSPAIGPDLGAGWQGARGALRLGLGVHGALFPSQFGGVAAPTTAGEGGRFSLLEGSLRGCAAYAFRALEIGPCLGLGVDHMSASGRGSQVSLSGSGTWASGQGAAVAAWSFSRMFAVSGLVGLAAPFSRPTFVVDSLATPAATTAVHRPSALSARIGLGLELRFF